MVKNQMKFHNVQIDMDLAGEVPPVSIDPNQLQQVFLNLLTNAADAMNDTGYIRIATRTLGPGAERQVETEFTDTGPGIYPNNLDKIFEPFFTTKPVGKGTGLGLPVSYGIVKKHGGDIIVKSKVGRGTSFFVRLPACKEEE
jgi:two-component system NtrC family sensor kinase